MSQNPVIEVIPSPPGIQDYPPAPPGPRGKNLRIPLFVGVFGLCLCVSQAYVWLRAPLYQSTASVLTVAPEEAGQPESKTAVIRQGKTQKQGFLASITESEPANNPGGSEHVTLQRQILLGVPVFQETLRRLEGLQDPPGLPRLTVADLHKQLSVAMIPDTNMVELKAEGSKPAILAPLVNAWVDAYQALREKTVSTAATTTHASLEEEARQLDLKIKVKRQALADFRETHNILSDTGADNTPMLRLKGLNDALNKAIDEQAKTSGKLSAIRAALARGEPVMPKDEAAGLAHLEKRAQELRELNKDLQRRYTPGYLAMNPQLKQVPEQLAQVEEQIRNMAEHGSRVMLSQAEQDHAAAQQAVAELRQKIDGLKRETAEFTNRFAEQDTMKEDLARLEEMNRETKAKLAKAETKPQDPYPPLQVVERAYPPTQAAWPDYWRDSGFSLLGSLLSALLVVSLVEYLSRIHESSGTAPAAMPSFQFFNLQGGLPNPQAEDLAPSRLPDQPAPLALESHLVRELSSHEIRILWDSTDEQTRQWIGLLLSGLSVAEAKTLRDAHFDRAANRLYVAGDTPREVPVPQRLRTCLSLPLEDEDAEDVAARIHLAAVDAGLTAPESISAETLRHTYIAYLVRQGIRLSELERIIGRIPAKNLSTYSRYSPPGPGLSARRVNWVYPALVEEDLAVNRDDTV